MPMAQFYNQDDDDDIEDRANPDLKLGDQEEELEQQQQAAPVTPVPALDASQIAEIVEQTFQKHVPQQQQAPRQMTPEEAAVHFQVFNADDQLVNNLNKLGDADATPEERRALLNQIRDGIVNQGFRAAELLLEQRVQELDQRYAPALAYAQQAEARKLQETFETKYPALKGQEQLVNSITAGLTQRGYRPKSADEAFDKVAEIAEQILKGANPEFKLVKNTASGPGGRPAMAGANMGGQTGGFQTVIGSGEPKKRGGLASIFKP